MSLASSFEENFGYKHTVETRAPGRVNLLGEHVDYNQGVVLPAAIDREVRLAAAPTKDGRVTLRALDLGKGVIFNLSEVEKRIDIDWETPARMGTLPGRGGMGFTGSWAATKWNAGSLLVGYPDWVRVELVSGSGGGVRLLPGRYYPDGKSTN